MKYTRRAASHAPTGAPKSFARAPPASFASGGLTRALQTLCTTNLPDRGVKVDLGWLRASLPADEFAKLGAANTDRPAAKAAYGIQARNLAKLNSAGVRVTLGTDGNRPWGPHEEMQDMVLAGMTPMEVIVAATRNSAEFLLIVDAGTLEAGKSADFVVLDASPLDDITTRDASRRSSCAARPWTAHSRSTEIPSRRLPQGFKAGERPPLLWSAGSAPAPSAVKGSATQAPLTPLDFCALHAKRFRATGPRTARRGQSPDSGPRGNNATAQPRWTAALPGGDGFGQARLRPTMHEPILHALQTEAQDDR